VNVVVFHGGRRVDAVTADDRGLAYGDGVFETMRVHRGAVHWWAAHWQRLRAGAQRLGLSVPDESLVASELQALFGRDSGVAKLLVTRGVGGRGYAADDDMTPTWLLSRHAVPAAVPDGLTLRWCETRLALQPRLAGVKHCNRLEQVLARNEWRDASIHEGLMLNLRGDVVCGTAANLFALIDGAWRTPDVSECGVAGVCREWVLDATGADVTRLQPDDVERADAVFLCNAVRGILPVARLGDRNWAPHAAVADLQARLATAHPAFATE